MDDVANVIRGASLLSAGSGSSALAQTILGQLSSSLTYQLVSPSELPKDANVLCVGRVGCPEAGTYWSVGGISSVFYQYMNLVKRTGQQWYVVPFDLSPETISACFALIMAAYNQVIGVVDCDGAGMGVPALDMLTMQDMAAPMTPACLNGLTDAGRIYSAVNFVNETTVGEVDSISRSFASQVPASFQPQSGIMAAWGCAADQLEDLAAWGTLSTCQKLGSYIGSGSYDGKSLSSALTSLGRRTAILASGNISTIAARVDKGLYRGRVKITNQNSTNITTVYVENSNISAWDSENYGFVGALPFALCWYNETRKVGQTNVDIVDRDINDLFSLLLVYPESFYTSSGAMAGVDLALRRSGYAGRILPPSFQPTFGGREVHHYHSIDLTKAPGQY